MCYTGFSEKTTDKIYAGRKGQHNSHTPVNARFKCSEFEALRATSKEPECEYALGDT